MLALAASSASFVLPSAQPITQIQPRSSTPTALIGRRAVAGIVLLLTFTLDPHLPLTSLLVSKLGDLLQARCFRRCSSQPPPTRRPVRFARLTVRI